MFVLGMSGWFTPASPAAEMQITPAPVEYTFGREITLRASLDTVEPASEVQVFLRSQGATETYSGPAVIENSQVYYLHDLIAGPLRAFSQVEYWFQVTPQAGEPFLSQTYTFFYEDNRFAWQVLSSDTFTIHWYEGDIEFAQQVLNAAEAGLVRAGRMLVLPAIQPLDIYVYATGLDMQSTLQLGGLHWLAGHADPDLGVAVVSLPAGPDQLSEIERQIPHEGMHLLLYQSSGPAYESLPVWLKEGLASANESRPNPNYYVLLSEAVEQDALIPMSMLCSSFPQDNTIYQAYAQSDSFVRYLFQHYGQTGMQSLLASYASGEGCETAPLSTTGMSLTELEKEWRRSALNDNILDLVLEALLPWGALLIVVLLVPFILVLSSRRKIR
jgi:hypothetical protein